MAGDTQTREQQLRSMAEDRGYVLTNSAADRSRTGVGEWFLVDLADHTLVNPGKGMTMDEAEAYMGQRGGARGGV